MTWCKNTRRKETKNIKEEKNRQTKNNNEKKNKTRKHRKNIQSKQNKVKNFGAFIMGDIIRQRYI